MGANEYLDREHSQLFLIRLWAEESDAGSDGEHGEESDGSGSESTRVEWCGRLQSVVSGQAQDFRGWPTLIDLLQEMAQTAGIGDETR